MPLYSVRKTIFLPQHSFLQGSCINIPFGLIHCHFLVVPSTYLYSLPELSQLCHHHGIPSSPDWVLNSKNVFAHSLLSRWVWRFSISSWKAEMQQFLRLSAVWVVCVCHWTDRVCLGESLKVSEELPNRPCFWCERAKTTLEVGDKTYTSNDSDRWINFRDW